MPSQPSARSEQPGSLNQPSENEVIDTVKSRGEALLQLLPPIWSGEVIFSQAQIEFIKSYVEYVKNLANSVTQWTLLTEEDKEAHDERFQQGICKYGEASKRIWQEIQHKSYFKVDMSSDAQEWLTKVRKEILVYEKLAQKVLVMFLTVRTGARVEDFLPNKATSLRARRQERRRAAGESDGTMSPSSVLFPLGKSPSMPTQDGWSAFCSRKAFTATTSQPTAPAEKHPSDNDSAHLESLSGVLSFQTANPQSTTFTFPSFKKVLQEADQKRLDKGENVAMLERKTDNPLPARPRGILRNWRNWSKSRSAKQVSSNIEPFSSTDSPYSQSTKPDSLMPSFSFDKWSTGA